VLCASSAESNGRPRELNHQFSGTLGLSTITGQDIHVYVGITNVSEDDVLPGKLTLHSEVTEQRTLPQQPVRV
jgi:hypothetical protein